MLQLTLVRCLGGLSLVFFLLCLCIVTKQAARAQTCTDLCVHQEIDYDCTTKSADVWALDNCFMCGSKDYKGWVICETPGSNGFAGSNVNCFDSGSLTSFDIYTNGSPKCPNACTQVSPGAAPQNPPIVQGTLAKTSTFQATVEKQPRFICRPDGE